LSPKPEEFFMMSIRLPACMNRARGGMILSCGLLLALGMFSGCVNKNAPADTASATPDQLTALRESIEKTKPGSSVGQVLVTFGQYASITGIPVKDVKVGQTISFIELNGNPISNGTVTHIVDDALHVKVDPAGKRPVQKGDVAVVLKD
jgi:uncharacterized protein with GYD domain